MYNSAIKAKQSSIPLNTAFSGVYTNDKVTVFKHDVCSGAHELFKNADVIYSETAWRQGYNKFTAGTIAQDTTFNEYIDSLKGIIRELGIPAFLVVGASFIKRLEPDKVVDITFKIHNYPHAKIAVYNYDGDLDVKDEYELREFIGKHWKTVLNPCCGYGNIIETSEKAICSDINDDCLNYIVETYNLRKR